MKQPTQNPRKASRPEQIRSTILNTMAGMRAPNPVSKAIIRDRIKPILAANILGPTSSRRVSSLRRFLMILPSPASMLYLGLRKALTRKSAARSANIAVDIPLSPFTPVTRPTIVVKNTSEAVVLTILLSLYSPVMGQDTPFSLFIYGHLFFS